MQIDLKRAYCFSKKQALQEILERDLWPFSQEINAGKQDDVHWHLWNTHIYLLSGEFELLYPQNYPNPIRAGDYLFIPARALHSVKITKPSKRLIGLTMPINLDEKNNFAPEEL
ncbi:cupin domain-containing protein [Roseofilum casamattae]|uniref:Cupin domain-containing protein n=1 Tax=Roseofilum casamattae BLCC-M143 TaxID=3022442 RepID=A0ABT7C3P9_9CYAN|nr:cupin domain-containing protein [Roseofilum casamattae]MDJ1185243.1 cupin domain-containing protein [Roseofilum casamattae BLCC-M143]